MQTKYGFDIKDEYVQLDAKRLTNQIWKLIPMNENQENWQLQLSNVIIEVAGLYQVLNRSPKFLILLSKLEGLRSVEDIDFFDFRRVVFESITLLNEVCHNGNEN